MTSDVPIDLWVATAVVLLQILVGHVLIARLKRDDFETFKNLGKPDLFWNNTPRTAWLFWKWMCSSAPDHQGKTVRHLVWFSRLLTILFMVWFFVRAVGIVQGDGV